MLQNSLKEIYDSHFFRVVEFINEFIFSCSNIAFPHFIFSGFLLFYLLFSLFPILIGIPIVMSVLFINFIGTIRDILL